MNSINSVDISFTFNWIFLLAGFVLIAAYTFYNYKLTIPPIPKIKKYILITIRIISLLIILILIFEPKLSLKFVNSVEPYNYIFLDNSNSITEKDSVKKTQLLGTALKDLIKNVRGKKEIFTFSNSVTRINNDSTSAIKISGSRTNFENVLNYFDNNKISPSTITIISDGIINDGSSPYNKVEKLAIPIFTIGIGDTVVSNDIKISDVSYNRYIYANEPTIIRVTVLTKGLLKETNRISFFENGKFINSKYFSVNTAGINIIDFDYMPKSSGQKKLVFKVDNFKNENNTANNVKAVYVNVLKSKLNILLVGNPSADYSFIKQSLKSDSKIRINEIVQISDNNILNLDKTSSYIDSSNILFLIGFPTAQTPINLTDKVFSAINKADKPFFFILSPQTDLNRLKRIKSKLPFSFARISSQTVWVQPSIVNSETGLLKNNGRFDKSLWNSLPPIAISKTDFRVKPEANLLSQISINNQVLFYPLIIADNIGNSNSIAILGFDIWRWKLQANKFNESIFDSFILNSVKWLNNFKHNKLFSLRTSQKVFFVGDEIILSAQLYDQTFSPINNANIVATVKTRDGINHFNLSLTGNGLYSGKVNQLPVGSYNLSAEAKIGNKIIGKSKVKIRIENSNLESSVTVMNNNLLRLISKLSGGKYFDISQFEKVNNAINNFNSTNKKEIAVTKTYDFFSFEWILFIIIFLFGLEWFLRKRSGLL